MVDSRAATIGIQTILKRSGTAACVSELVKCITAETGDIVRPILAPIAPKTPSMIACPRLLERDSDGRTACEKATLGAVPEPLITARIHVSTGLRTVARSGLPESRPVN